MKADGSAEWPLWVRMDDEIQNMFSVMAPLDGDGEGESTAKAWGIDPWLWNGLASSDLRKRRRTRRMQKD